MKVGTHRRAGVSTLKSPSALFSPCIGDASYVQVVILGVQRSWDLGHFRSLLE